MRRAFPQQHRSNLHRELKKFGHVFKKKVITPYPALNLNSLTLNAEIRYAEPRTSILREENLDYAGNFSMKLENAELLPSITLPDDDYQIYDNKGTKQEIKYEDQKFLLNNIWYRRGQHVFLEGDHTLLFAAVICGISQHNIWFFKCLDNSQFRIHVDHFLYDEISIIPRRDPVKIIRVTQV